MQIVFSITMMMKIAKTTPAPMSVRIVIMSGKNKKEISMVYRFRIENAFTFERKSLTIKCSDPAHVMARLAASGWIVQIYYEV